MNQSHGFVEVQLTKISDGLAWHSLRQDVAHGFNVLISVVQKRLCFVSTDVLIIKMPCSTKLNSELQSFSLLQRVTILALPLDVVDLKPS